jgi:hypothetical protein
LHSVSPGSDGRTFGLTMDVGNTALQLMRAHEQGQQLPLVVLSTDTQILALDAVNVTEVFISGHDPAAAYAALLAEAVRFV